MLFSLEERYFSDIYIARIVRLGFAAFFDAGRTWFSDNPDDHGYGALADVGFGLRFESTRTRQDRVLHVDFAFPLVDGPDVDTMQILRGDQGSVLTVRYRLARYAPRMASASVPSSAALRTETSNDVTGVSRHAARRSRMRPIGPTSDISSASLLGTATAASCLRPAR